MLTHQALTAPVQTATPPRRTFQRNSEDSRVHLDHRPSRLQNIAGVEYEEAETYMIYKDGFERSEL